MNLKGISMKNILITGGAGLVGTVLTQGLKDKYNVKIINFSNKDRIRLLDLFSFLKQIGRAHV